MANEFFYWVMIALFFTHELDAVKRHEWRIIPFVNRLPNSTAGPLFIYLHVPLFLLIIWHSRAGADSTVPLFISLFAIIHLAMHLVFKKHPKNEFIGFGSWAIIVLTAVFGALHLVSYSTM